MRSTANRRAVIVGIFIFLGLAIFIWTVLTLGSQKKTFANSIDVKSVFANVNGLQKGNNIWFSGVKVGTIHKVGLIGNGKVEVDMNIDKQAIPYIRKNAKAKISTDGLIGNKIIEIYGGTTNSPPLENGDILNNEEILNTDAMMATLSKNNDNLLAVTQNFIKITDNMVEGKGSIGKLLKDETFADELDKTVTTLRVASGNLEKLSANVSNYTAKLNKPGNLANDLVTDTVVFSKLRGTMTQLQNVAENVSEVIDNLKTTTTTLNNGLSNKNAPAGMLLSDEKAANGIKATLQNLQSASKKLDEDLEAVQHNFLFRKYFKKKAKEDTRVVLDTLVN